MARMTDKLRFAVSTAPQPWLQMPGVRADLIRHDAEPTHPQGVQRWIRRYYQRMPLA
jgi:hypothetical protein